MSGTRATGTNARSTASRLLPVESLFRGPVTVFPDPEHSEAEERFKAIGRTDDGRGVLIVFHPAQAGRGHLHPPGQRPLHAREGG